MTEDEVIVKAKEVVELLRPLNAIDRSTVLEVAHTLISRLSANEVVANLE